MHISVPYGTGFQEAHIDESRVAVELVDPPKRVVSTPAEEFVRQALDNPIGSVRLEEMARPDDKVTIMVNDQTRPGPYPMMCGALLERLHRAGVRDENITFVIATGSHRAPTPEELHTLLGGLEERYAVHVHDCKDGKHVFMGTTKTGNVPIYLDKFVAETSSR